MACIISDPNRYRGCNLPVVTKKSAPNRVAGVGWKFLRRLPGQPNANGDITRMFNTGDSSPPASFNSLVDRNNSDAVSALIYGREGIANCFDASQARAAGSGSLGLDFSFSRHQGDKAHRMRELLGLPLLAKRLTEPGVTRKQLGLGEVDCLAGGPTSDLRTLLAVERRGGGMPGSLEDDRSVLAQALINVGEAQTSVGAAGSYGYGKAAVGQASRIRSIIVYTCFAPPTSDSVSRRLVGVTYWGMHDLPDGRYTGWTLFGHDAEHTVRALEDGEADALAAELGIPVRDPSDADDLGTSFLIVDPGFTAAQLRSAIELAWWPLLQKTRDVALEVSITDEVGRVSTPRVDDQHPLLGQFVSNFQRAESVRHTGDDVRGEREVALGARAGITALEVRDPQGPIRQSLIALMRSPLMVVNYEPIKTATAAQPLVGVFVAHESTNELLRSVEPAEHDKWLRRNVAGLRASADAIEVSKAVLDEQAAAVNALRPPEPPPVFGLHAFSKHFPAVDTTVAKPRPPRPRQVKQRLVRVNLVHDQDSGLAEVDRPTRRVLSDGRLEAIGEVKFWLDPDRARRVGRRSLDATITIGAEIAEDGGGRVDSWSVDVVQKVRAGEAQFTRITEPGQFPVQFVGTFTVGLPVYFVATSAAYENDWTLNLVFDCSPWDEVAPVAEPMGAN